MTFNEWWEENGYQCPGILSPRGMCEEAYKTGAEAVNTLPLRVMFDKGVEEGRNHSQLIMQDEFKKQIVAECYQIAASHEFGSDAAKTIRETFKFKIETTL